MKKTFTLLTLSVLTFAFVCSCEKDLVDPTLPPVIEVASGLDAENKVNILLSGGKNIDFLIDLQEPGLWRACTHDNNYDIVYAYGIEARMILDVRQKKIEKKLRNVVTVYPEIYDIFGENNYLVNIFNTQKVRFYKVSTSASMKSPQCTSLNYFFSSGQPYGGVFVR